MKVPYKFLYKIGRYTFPILIGLLVSSFTRGNPSLTKDECTYYRSENSQPTIATSCHVPSLDSDEIRIHATFPKSKYGELRFYLSDKYISPNGQTNGRVIFNDQPGNFNLDSRKKIFQVILDDGQSVIVKTP
jgi:hypothetical protein